MPLLLHGSFLNWLTLFGFPFTVSHGSGLVVPAKVPMFKMLMTIQILSVAFMIMFYRLGKDGLLNINYIKESIGLSGMDMVLINGALLITFVDAIALVKLLRKNMEQLNNLSMMISDDKVAETAKRRLAPFVSFFFICDAVASVIAFNVSRIFYEQLLAYGDYLSDGDLPIKVIFVSSAGCMTIFGLFHPILLGGFYTVQFYLYAVEESIKVMTREVQSTAEQMKVLPRRSALTQEDAKKKLFGILFTREEASSTIEPHNGTQVNTTEVPSNGEMIHRCFKQHKLLSNTCNILAPLILTEVFLNILVVIISAYGSASIVFSTLGLLRALIVGVYGLAFTAFALQCFFLFSAGQGLENSQEKLMVALHKFREMHWDNLSEQNRIDLEILDQQLSHPSTSSVSPYGFFTLNHSGFLGVVAAVSTYLIVLLQFKQSE